ncbi:MAG: alpha/beta hydrolase [Promicromonosporaceae bacterium]|nr:alpha/beta hydrolase [Promicromonosporaceae bacterium]
MNTTTQAARSADGTRIEYLSTGRGPGLIVVPGALATAESLAGLAGLLADRYTVHVVQRRGRGGSGPQGERYGIERECEDLEAVRARTGARLLLGHSFGGLVALRFARGNADVDAVAVYEPGVSDAGSVPVGWIERAQREVDAGEDLEAFLTFVRGTNPERSGRVPRWVLRPALRRAIPADHLRGMLALMPQAIREHVEVGRLDSRLADYAAITAPTLVLRGDGTGGGPGAAALDRLAATIPGAQGMVLEGLDHLAPEDKPEQVAPAVGRFLDHHAARTAAR